MKQLLMKHPFLKAICTIAAIAFFSIAYLSTPAPTTAQSTEFSSDPEEFVEQMDDIFKLSQDKKKAKDFIQTLKLFMQTPLADESRKQQIIADCNLLKKKKARAYPDYNTLITTMMALCDENARIKDKNYNVWHAVLNEKLRAKGLSLQKISNYLSATNAYLETGAVAKSNSALWKTDAPQVTFSNEGTKLYIEIPTSRIICYAQGDSIDIVDTKGVVDFDAKTFVGEKGTITWERCELPRQQAHAEFGTYNIDMSKSFFNIDSVTFTNTDYFNYPLYGRIEHKVVPRKSTLGQTYPKFFTKDDQRREVKAIFPNIDYEGGFAQIGKRFEGSGTAQNPAIINIYRKDTLFIVARALSFALYTNKIESSDTKINITLNDGEIRHPGLRFRYDDANKEITLLRGGNGMEKSNYFDTYHMVTFDVEQIKWKMNSDEMNLGMVEGASQGLALFESIDYYRQDDYNQMQGMALTHPFQLIKDFYRYNGGYPFDVRQFAQYINQDISQVRQQILQYSYDNFVDYDEATDEVIPTQRLFNYLDNRLAEAEATDPRKRNNPNLRNPRLADVDYDVMIFESKTTDYDKNVRGLMPNGTIDLRNYDIKLNGVTGIAISDYQNVAFYPDSGRVFLKKNRDFQFNGKVQAGMVELKGMNFYFSYNDYNIILNRIESMNMRVFSNDVDQFGMQVKAPVENTIHDLTGYLQIDIPNNKSGLRGRNPKYPELTSTKESYVYYDADYIQDGQYTRDKFYYTVDPFVFNDINNIRYSNTKFDGVLTSGILPDIRHELVIRREDNSLGFVTQSPEEGYPLYDGRATLMATIDLSNAGLKGGGDLHYIKSVSRSNEFTFLPDLALGNTQNFSIEETTSGVTFPGVQLGAEQQVTDERGHMRSGETEMEFFPFEEKLNVYNTVGKFKMFPSKKVEDRYDCTLDGGLSVTPRGLRGLGEAQLPFGAKLEASIMEFTDHTFTSDTTYFAQYRKLENGDNELVSDGLRRDIARIADGKFYDRIYSPTKGRVPYETNDALTEIETFIKIRKEHKSEMNDEIDSKCMVSTVDFNDRIGKFSYKSAEGGEKRYNTIKFKTWVKEFTWDMDRNEQTIGRHGANPGLKFECTKNERERVDPLTFNVPYAIYNASTNEMHCEEVKYVNCADAKINLADDGLLTIRSTNDRNTIAIDPLRNTKIDLKTDSTYHQIYNARSVIKGAVDYTAIGDYDFYNKEKIKYTIFMDSIFTSKEELVDSLGKKQTHFVTNAFGHNTEDINFDRHFAFKGEMRIKGWRQLLEWDGGVRMLHEATKGPKGYSYFTSIINPEKVEIPINEKLLVYKQDPKQRHEIFKDFFIRKDSTHVYSSFTEVRKDNSDLSIMTSQGILFYNNIFERFDITSKEKRIKTGSRGSIISFLPKENAITGFGQLKLGVTEMMGNRAPFVITSAGNIRDDRNTNTETVNALMNISFPFSPELATMIYKKIMATNAPTCDTANYKYESRLLELYDTTGVKNIKANRWTGLDPKKQLLPTNGDLFTFDNVDLTWLTSEKAYICDGTVNLMMMHERNVNKKVHLTAEFIASNKSVGLVPRIYMKISTDDGYWLYINLLHYPTTKKWVLNMRSSDDEFNEYLSQNPVRSGGYNCIRVEENDKKFMNFRDNFNAQALLSGQASGISNEEEEEFEEEQQ